MVSSFGGEFPSTTTMARAAERAYGELRGDTVLRDPDGTVVGWTNTEFELFRVVEESYYSYVTERPMGSLASSSGRVSR